MIVYFQNFVISSIFCANQWCEKKGKRRPFKILGCHITLTISVPLLLANDRFSYNGILNITSIKRNLYSDVAHYIIHWKHLWDQLLWAPRSSCRKISVSFDCFLCFAVKYCWRDASFFLTCREEHIRPLLKQFRIYFTSLNSKLVQL